MDKVSPEDAQQCQDQGNPEGNPNSVEQEMKMLLCMIHPDTSAGGQNPGSDTNRTASHCCQAQNGSQQLFLGFPLGQQWSNGVGCFSFLNTTCTVVLAARKQFVIKSVPDTVVLLHATSVSSLSALVGPYKKKSGEYAEVLPVVVSRSASTGHKADTRV